MISTREKKLRDLVVLPDSPLQQLLRKREEHIGTYDASNRAGTVYLRITLHGKPVASLCVDVERDSSVLQAGCDIIQPQ